MDIRPIDQLLQNVQKQICDLGNENVSRDTDSVTEFGDASKNRTIMSRGYRKPVTRYDENKYLKIKVL